MKKALITGVTGQDGAYLSKLLLENGYKVYGTFRRSSTPNYWRLQFLDVLDKISLVPVDITDQGSMYEALKISEPDEVYHLAAQSFVEASFQAPVATGITSGISVVQLLEGIRLIAPEAKFYFAATSEMFGEAHRLKNGSLNESDFFRPMSPYAASKLYGYWINDIYRQSYSLFACSGILFNHESPLRGLEFVTRKIANGLVKASLGVSKSLKLGNLEAQRDWGYAPEYVEAMWRMLQQDYPEDFVIATGEMHSVREFLDLSADIVGIDWQSFVKVDKNFMRPLDVPSLSGDPSKAERVLGWTPKVKFDDLVKIMVNEEMERWNRYLKGERFPWDVPNYPSESVVLNRSKFQNGQ